jgi:hypothetical protein
VKVLQYRVDLQNRELCYRRQVVAGHNSFLKDHQNHPFHHIDCKVLSADLQPDELSDLNELQYLVDLQNRELCNRRQVVARHHLTMKDHQNHPVHHVCCEVLSADLQPDELSLLKNDLIELLYRVGLQNIELCYLRQVATRHNSFLKDRQNHPFHHVCRKVLSADVQPDELSLLKNYLIELQYYVDLQNIELCYLHQVATSHNSFLKDHQNHLVHHVCRKALSVDLEPDMTRDLKKSLSKVVPFDSPAKSSARVVRAVMVHGELCWLSGIQWDPGNPEMRKDNRNP